MDNNNSNKSAHAIAVAKYNAKNYKTFSVNMKHDDYQKLIVLSGLCKTSKSGLIIKLIQNLSDNEIIEVVNRK